MLSARVGRADRSFSSEFDHMLLKVTLDDPWLADVGFGDSFVSPLLLQSEATELVEGGARFRVAALNGSWEALRRDGESMPVTLYRFTEVARELREFAPMCHFHQTSPESHFTQNRVCSKALPDGRITISGMRLITTKNGLRKETVLNGREELRECLRQRFGIDFAEDIDWSRLTG
jgi:N-hydroxyarylamine O-acetyltransferase